jgi:hypothetical protein
MASTGRVFILGAGSSVYAGFPLGKDLWEFLVDHCGLQAGAMETVSNYLASLGDGERRVATEDLERLLTRFERGEIPAIPVPPDASVDDRHQRRAVRASLRHTLQNAPGFRFDAFWEAQRVRRRSAAAGWSFAQLSSIRDLTYEFDNAFLLHHACIRHGRRHFHGSGEWPPSRSQSAFSRACPCRQRLRIGRVRRMFDALGRAFHPGDTIVTFNYDATVESSLWAAGKWHFIDGYGVPIEMTSPALARLLRQARFRSPSPVKVLKAHGSINWVRSVTTDRIGLNYLGLLFDLPVFSTYREARDPEDGMETEYTGTTLLAPTYQKDYAAHAILGRVWESIDRVVEQASEITVMGYSLPPGDTAARDRLAAALARNRRIARVGLVSPGDPTQSHWQRFLDGLNLRLESRGRSMEEWLSARVRTRTSPRAAPGADRRRRGAGSRRS